MPAEGALLDPSALRCTPQTLLRWLTDGVRISSTETTWGQAASIALPPRDEWTRIVVRGHVVAGQGDLLVTTPEGRPVAREALPLGPTPCSVLALLPPLPTGGRLTIVSTDALGRPLVACLTAVAVDRIAHISDSAAADALVVVYDADARGGTFSVVPFLVTAERERRALGAAFIDLVVLPESRIAAQSIDEAYRAAYPQSARRHFVEVVIPSIASCIPSVRSVEVAPDRARGWRLSMDAGHAVFGADLSAIPLSTPPSHIDHASVFTDRELATGAARLRAPDDAIATVSSWLAELTSEPGTGVVTVTLRSEAYLPERNSDVDEWAAALIDAGMAIVLVPDPSIGAPPPPDGPWMRLPFTDPGHQLALYELATLNLAQFGNHSMLLLGSTAPFVVWIPRTGPGALLSDEVLDALGLGQAAPPPFLMPHQRLEYAEPTSWAVQAEVEKARGDPAGLQE